MIANHEKVEEDLIDEISWTAKYDWKKFIHVVTYLERLKHLQHQRPNSLVTSPQKLEKADIIVFKKTQGESFKDVAHFITFQNSGNINEMKMSNLLHTEIIIEKTLAVYYEEIRADVGEKVSIISGRELLKFVIRQFLDCDIKKAQPKVPELGNLHEARQHFDCPPFTHAGIDCFGRYFVKQGRSKVKRWGVTFTYVTYRAVHFELISDMTV
jgi:hypothetical protein